MEYLADQAPGAHAFQAPRKRRVGDPWSAPLVVPAPADAVVD